MATGARKIRIKKLNVKTPLPILREDEIDATEYESLTNENSIATGVEQAEENEYHLQKALQGPGASTDKEIPVPPPQESELNYDELYPLNFPQPSTYIRFSQTVEECIGCQYDMTEDDDEFLKAYNQKRPAGSQLSEDDFERIMEVFEDTASIQAPYASVDKTVVAYDMMVPGLNQLDAAKLMLHAKEIYEYWRSRRQTAGNGSLHPSLKFETHQDSDDMDPYVCFRRREVRQTRKTRARDVQSADKLKRLRRELEDGRQLIILSHEREVLKRDLMLIDRMVFEQRAKLKEAKVRLGIKEHDEDLVNQKPQKRKAPEGPAAPRQPATQLRMPIRPDGRSMDSDLTLLADKLAEKENELRNDIQMKIQNHRNWNKNHVDLTREPLSPVKGPSVEMSFRPAKTHYLMTPPASASSESADEPTAMDLDAPPAAPVFQFKGIPQHEYPAANPPAFRRRMGRLNRLWIDRRGLASPPREIDGGYSDRWKYDDDDSDDEQPVYEVDPFDIRALKFRATIPLSNHQMYQYRGSRGAVESGSQAAGGRPALPAPQRQGQGQAQAQAQAQAQIQPPVAQPQVKVQTAS